MAKVFISHSHQDREVAGEIKDKVEPFGVNVFVAHEDIKPTQDWQESILDNLKHCDAFVALLTNRFEESEWTDQETGFAVALSKIIIPIKIDLDPYGFIKKYQALKWDAEKPKLSSRKLIRLLVEKNVLSTDNIIEGFSNSYTFENAELNADLLNEVGTFSRRQINEIVGASIQNNQIWDSFGAKPILRKLFTKYSDRIDPDLMRQWKQRLKEA